MARYNGIVLVDKPQGWTSFDVVNYVRKMIARLEEKKPKNTKVGHTGTLDPLATGLLVLCVGSYTKKVSELIKHDKTYEVELILGKQSTTGDAEGELTNISDNQPTRTAIKNCLDSYIGTIQQTPPAYSAVKVQGKRAYELARAGKPVELAPRTVIIYSLTDIDYAYPHVCFTVVVSSGTYIRSLAEDIGRQLGTGAYMSALRRIQVGSFSIDDALPPQALTDEYLQKTLVE